MSSTTLVGIFDDYTEAQQATQKLEDVGIPKQSIQVSAGQSGSTPAASRTSSEPEEHEGAISRFFSNLFGSDDEPDAAHYSEAVRRGNAVVTVSVADEDRVDEVAAILEDCGAVDVDERVEQWKASGYMPPASTRPMAGEGASEKLDVVEEELKVGKRTVQEGGVRVRRHVTDRPVEEQVSLHSERADVTRTKVDRPATEAEMQTAFKDKSLEVRETSEEAVVSKTARVVEEVSVGKKSSDRTETVKGNVRRTDVDVEKIAGESSPRRPAQSGMAGSMSRYTGPERRMNANRAYAGQERRMAAM
ncbi:YsnF/AvaK domain-containing protein [Methylibium sp.]|uniref:YsnF/AvaK domain-containing protein n=1 Tax=Methylibium sp. TaxID=2067992 RepID=UPI0017BEB8A9|nr:YsnF/AvaK domain-containing protein [Methylibium sp.]MBA3591270.1 YsnF/AvaK domain-containing protein [Methylibium sp.]